MSLGGKPPFHHDFSALTKSPAKRLFSRNSGAENRDALFPGIALVSRNSAAENRRALFLELRLFSRNSGAENRRALFLELLWTGRIPVL